MGTEMTYDQIYKALFSEGIEEYVPDGVSVSHPVVDIREGILVDCFLLFSSSRDRSRYTAPTARIVIDSENKELIEFRSVEEQPFSVYEGIDYYTNDGDALNNEKAQAAEQEHRTSYIEIRDLAFKDSITKTDKEMIIRYIKSLKSVELVHLQPYLFELGQTFFQWVRTVLK